MYRLKLLVVANQTVDSDELYDALRERTERGPLTVTLLVPQDQQAGLGTRVKAALERLHAAGIDAEAMLGDVDPALRRHRALGPPPLGRDPRLHARPPAPPAGSRSTCRTASPAPSTRRSTTIESREPARSRARVTRLATPAPPGACCAASASTRPSAVEQRAALGDDDADLLGARHRGVEQVAGQHRRVAAGEGDDDRRAPGSPASCGPSRRRPGAGCRPRRRPA